MMMDNEEVWARAEYGRAVLEAWSAWEQEQSVILLKREAAVEAARVLLESRLRKEVK